MKPSVQRVAHQYFNRTARVLTEKEGLARLKKELESETLLLAWWQDTGVKGKLEVKGDKILYTSPLWQYEDSDSEYVLFSGTGHADAVKAAKKLVVEEFGYIGLKVFKLDVKVSNKGTDLAYDEDHNEIQVDAGNVQVFAEVELPKYMRTVSLEDIAKEMKAEGYSAFMQGDVLNVQFQSGSLRKWEYARWDMNLTQYQDANNKLHQEWAKELQRRYPRHVVEPENGYHENGYSVAFIKMPST